MKWANIFKVLQACICTRVSINKHNWDVANYWKHLNHIILNKQQVVVLLYFDLKSLSNVHKCTQLCQYWIATSIKKTEKRCYVGYKFMLPLVLSITVAAIVILCLHNKLSKFILSIHCPHSQIN